MATANQTTRPTGSPSRTARDYLAEISTTAKAKPMAAIAYGPPGVGKTSLGAAIPGRVFLIDDNEDGINTLKAGGLAESGIPVMPSVSAWQDVLGSLEALAAGKHDYKCLVIDTLGGMERLCHEYICQTQFKGDWGEKGFSSYARGYEVALPEWRLFLNSLDKCRTRGMSILAITHSIVKPYKNPEGEDYDRFVPDMHHKTWGLTHRWADMVLFLNYYVETVKERGDHKAKGRGGQTRTMYTEYHAAYEAKNRSGLPAEIDMGTTGTDAWNNLRNALRKDSK